MLSIRAPHRPTILPSVTYPRTAAGTTTGADMTAPSLPTLYGASAVFGAFVGSLAYVGSHLTGAHPLVGSLLGGAVGGVATFGAAMLVGSGGGSPTPAK